MVFARRECVMSRDLSEYPVLDPGSELGVFRICA